MKKKFTRILGVGITIALLTSLMTVAIPASALSQPTVSLAAKDVSNPAGWISKENVYTVTFTAGAAVPSGGELVVAFPADTNISSITASDVLVEALQGIGGGPIASLNAANVTVTGAYPFPQTMTIELPVGGTLGAGSLVGLTIGDTAGNCVVNPTSSGTYTLTVATQTFADVPIEAAVTSSSYSVTPPVVPPLSGIVSVKNPAGILMSQYTGGTAIAQGIADATGTGYIVEIGPGTYSETTYTTVVDGITFKATGAVADTIIIGNWSIGNNLIILDGFTLQGTVAVAGGGLLNPNTIKNCVLNNGFGTASETLIDQNSGYLTVQDCQLSTTAGILPDVGMDIAGTSATITGCSFAVGSSDKAIEVTGGTPIVTVMNSSVTGASGVGYEAGVDNTGTITDTTFDGLTKAVYLTANATLTLRGCAITNSTNPDPYTFGSAIDLNWAGPVLIENNDIENNAGYSVDVAGNAGNVTAIGNSMSGNVKGFRNADASATVNAVLNWWGNASGPADPVSNPSGTGDPIAVGIGLGTVLYKPWAMALIPDVATGSVAADGTLDKSATVGVVYTSSVATTGIALARYTSNPAALEPPYAALVEGYYDVYVPDALGTQTVKFYNPAIAADTVVYYWSEVAGAWSACSDQGVAGTGAYAWVRISTETLPSNVELGGTPFALVTVPASPDVDLQAPAVGAYNVSITPTFTWTVAPGAIRYEIALSEDPTFAIIEWSYNVDDFFYKAEEELRYSTTYYWRVRAVTGEPYQAGFPPAWVTPAGPWATGIFTTEAEPEVVEPVTEITVETPEVTVTPGEVTVDVAPAVPDYLLWTIVGIGAVLVIALIVLIVRTRRVA